MTEITAPKITVLKRRTEGFTAERLRSLKTAEEVAPFARIKADRILHYANSNLCPHYRVDGEILFDETELQVWVAHNLLHHFDGTRDMRLTVLGSFPPPAVADLPHELRLMAKTIREIPTEFSPGVYFLCHSGLVVYVGQSTKPMQRVVQHQLSGKTFDSVYFLACPKDELDWLESSFIHALRPALNAVLDSSGEMAAPIPRHRLKERA